MPRAESAVFNVNSSFFFLCSAAVRFRSCSSAECLADRMRDLSVWKAVYSAEYFVFEVEVGDEGEGDVSPRPRSQVSSARVCLFRARRARVERKWAFVLVGERVRVWDVSWRVER